jgi:hypothetical protein
MSNGTHPCKRPTGFRLAGRFCVRKRGRVAYRTGQYVSTSYVERQNLSLRMGQRRFTRLTNGFSKKLDNHIAAVALYVCHYNLVLQHEALRTTPAKALGVVDKTWSIGQLVDSALAVAPALPTETPPDRRRKFMVIQGGKTQP